MEPWIYDEDRWPSGCAGGLVTKEPPFRRKYLTLTLNEAADSSEPPLAVFAARIDGLSLSPGYRSFDRLQPGETKLVFRVHTMQPQSVYNGFTDSDRLSLAATERFLDVTHRQYAARCTEFSSIRGVFTDEPHRGMVFSDFSDPGEERRWSLPWTDNLPEAFEAAYGEPLLPRLPELFLLLRGKPVSRLKWQYMELLQTLFMTRFLQPVRRWAQENGLKTTGHFLHEDSLSAQAVPTGSLMRCYEYLDEPGIDNLTAFNFTPWAVKQLESAARQFGKTKKAFGVVRRDGLADDVPGLQVHCKLADASGHQCALPASGVVYHAGAGKTGLSGVVPASGDVVPGTCRTGSEALAARPAYLAGNAGLPDAGATSGRKPLVPDPSRLGKWSGRRRTGHEKAGTAVPAVVPLADADADRLLTMATRAFWPHMPQSMPRSPLRSALGRCATDGS